MFGACYADTALDASQVNFEEVRFVMPAQAGIQKEYASASGYASWIPAFAGMTLPLAIPQNLHN
jgi:hypothetical protein